MLVHLFNNAETYAVLLVWIVIPLGYGACYLFVRNHYGWFAAVAEGEKETPREE